MNIKTNSIPIWIAPGGCVCVGVALKSLVRTLKSRATL